MNSEIQPCTQWEEPIAARHADDLSPEQHAALKTHLANCSSCSQVYADYSQLTEQIRALPAPLIQPLPRLFSSIHATSEQKEGGPLIKIAYRRKTLVPWTNRLNTAIAVAVVGLLIVSASALFVRSGSLVGGPPSSGTLHEGTSGMTYTQATNPPAFCKDFGIDTGGYKMCQAGKFKLLNIAKTVPPDTLTIIATYLDANKAIVGFSITRKPPAVMPPGGDGAYPMLIAQDGTELRSLGGAAHGPDPNEKLQTLTFWFEYDSTSIKLPDKASELLLKVKFQLPIAEQGTEIVLDVPFPVYPQSRVATPNQTVKLNQGEELTLEKVVVTPGSIFMRFHSKNIADPLVMLFTDQSYVTIGEKKAQFQFGGSSFDNNVITYLFDYPLYDDPGKWTYTLPTARGGDPLTFSFTIP